MDDRLSISSRELYAYARGLWKDYPASPISTEHWTNFFKSIDIYHSNSITMTPCWRFDIDTGYPEFKCTYIFYDSLMSCTEYKFTFYYDINSVKNENKMVKDFLEINKEWNKLRDIKDDILYKKYLTMFIKKYQIENDF